MKIGDILFTRSRYHGLKKVNIEKITPKGSIRVSDGSLLNTNLFKKTSDPWDSSRYYAWTKELEDEYTLENLKMKLKIQLENLDLSEMDIEDIYKLINAIKNI